MRYLKTITGIILGCATVLLVFCTTCRAVRYAEQQYSHEYSQLVNNRHDSFPQSLINSNSPYIAHGGGTGAYLYTNSQEAVADSIKQGFKFIELDMLKTADNHILAAHDWDYFSKLTAAPAHRNTCLHEAMQRKINGALTPLAADGICRLMQQYTDWILVADKISDFELLLREIPYPDRMIVEVFSAQEYLRARRAGIRYPAFCVAHEAALQQALVHGYPLVTISAGLFLAHIEQMQKLYDKNVCIMVYGTESLDVQAFKKEHCGRRASLLYIGDIVQH